MVHALELSLPGNDAGPRPDPGIFRKGGGGYGFRYLSYSYERFRTV